MYLSEKRKYPYPLTFIKLRHTVVQGITAVRSLSVAIKFSDGLLQFTLVSRFTSEYVKLICITI